MEIEKTLKEVAKYVASRILNNDFEFIKFDGHQCTIEIDGLLFDIWTASGYKFLNFSRVFSFQITKKINLFESDTDRQKAYNMLLPYISK